MNIPGFVYTALIAGLSAFLVVLGAGIELNITEMWGPVAIAAIGAIAKAIETWKPTETATRSIQQPRSGLVRFLFG